MIGFEVYHMSNASMSDLNPGANSFWVVFSVPWAASKQVAESVEDCRANVRPTRGVRGAEVPCQRQDGPRGTRR